MSPLLQCEMLPLHSEAELVFAHDSAVVRAVAAAVTPVGR